MFLFKINEIITGIKNILKDELCFLLKQLLEATYRLLLKAAVWRSLLLK